MKLLDFKSKALLVFLGIFSFYNCNSPEFSNPCDPKDNSYTKALIYKTAIGEKSAYCGVSFFPSEVAAPTNFSYFSSTATYANGATISLSPTITGTGVSYTISPSLPSGVSLNSLTGVISGAYSSYAGSTSSYTITAANSAGSASYTLKLTFFGKIYLKTGVTQCYVGNSATTTTCSGTGQDGEYQYGSSANLTGPTLVGASDYITTDNNTGLFWKSCNEGKSDPACETGAFSSVTMSVASSNCTALNSGSGYANRTDWRLPTAQEYGTILNYSGSNPATFSTYFPASSGAGNWSSTFYAPSAGASGWYASFTDGTYGTTGIGSTNHYRCVAGTSSYPTSLLVDNNDSTITDVNTGLIWQKCSLGLSGTNCTTGTASTYDWQTALTTCNSQTLNGRAWRLPSVNEFRALVDFTATTSPAVNSTYFPGTISGNYWSSTTLSAGGNAWRVIFGLPNSVLATSKASPSNVRCVATGP